DSQKLARINAANGPVVLTSGGLLPILDGSNLTNVSATIGASSVNTAALQSDVVTTAKIINAGVQTAKLATDAVTNTAILNATIGTAKLASIVNSGAGSAGAVVVLDSGAKLPALDGSQLTSLNVTRV